MDTIGTWIASQFSTISALEIVLALIFGLAAGILVSFVYKKTYRGVLYSPSFGLALIMMTLITTPVVAAIRSNVALSMGMVGALSIVRFRTAIKDPLDTAYMFWALTMGILLGAGLYLIALLVAVVISLILLFFSFVKLRSPESYLLVLHFDENAQGAINSELANSVRFYRMRSKTVSRNGVEMTVEVRLEKRGDLVSNMLDIEGVHDATLVACQTEAGA